MPPTTRLGPARAPADDDIRYAAHLRGLNLERVLAVARDRQGPFTRAELIEATGLSAPTVGSLAVALIRSGLLTDLGAGPSRGGRRPSTMELNARYGFVAAIHLGPAQTWLAVADLRGEILERRAVPTPKLAPGPLLAQVASELRRLMRDLDVPTNRLLAIGAGAPGVVDRERGMVVALAPNLVGWSRVPMGAILRRALRTPVIVDNDVNLAILGEHWQGAARGHDNCAFVTIGTGIGAGVMIDGRLHHGHHYLAGEIALMCMAPQHVDTDFGAKGCLESLAGLEALSARWSHRGRDNDQGWVGALLEAAADGDPLARKAVHETMTLIGMAIANLSVVLDPSIIVVGGPLFVQGPTLIESVRQIVSKIVPTPGRIVTSALGEEAPLIGSVLVATIEARAQLRRQLRSLGETTLQPAPVRSPVRLARAALR
jgi:glucokinase